MHVKKRKRIISATLCEYEIALAIDSNVLSAGSTLVEMA